MSYSKKYYKSYRAYDSLRKLPRFVDQTTDSSFFKLLNIPNIELDSIKKDLDSSQWNLIPGASNLTLPAAVEAVDVDLGFSPPAGTGTDGSYYNYTEVSLYDFTYGNPTDYVLSATPSLPTFSTSIIDFHYLKPFHYMDSDDILHRIDEGYVALKDGNSWFEQKIELYDTTKLVTTIDLPTIFQNIDNSLVDEWMELNSDGEYTINRAAVRNVKVIYVEDQVELTEGIDYHFNDLEGKVIQIHAPYRNKSLVVEYEYAPDTKLHSISYLLDRHNILYSSPTSHSYFYLLSDDSKRNVPVESGNGVDVMNDISDNVVLIKEQFAGLGEKIVGNFIVEKTWRRNLFSLMLETTQYEGHNIYTGYMNCDDWDNDTTINKLTVNGNSIQILTDPTDTILSEHNLQAVIDYGIIGWISMGTIRIVAVAPYPNAEIEVKYFSSVQTTGDTLGEPVVDSGKTYTQNGVEFKYGTLASINSTNLYPHEDSPGNAVVLAQQQGITHTVTTSDESFTHRSLAYYPYTKHIAEEDFIDSIVSLNAQPTVSGSYLEFYTTAGAIHERIPIDSYEIDGHVETIPQSIRRYNDCIYVLIKVLMETNISQFYVRKYDIHDYSYTSSDVLFTENETENNKGSIWSFTITDENKFIFISSFVESGDDMIKVASPKYNYFVRTTPSNEEDIETHDGLWFREIPANADNSVKDYWTQSSELVWDRLITEQAVDHWGRILGSDRWPKESLKDYTKRLTNIASSKMDVTLQGAVNGLSAFLNLDAYDANLNSNINTTIPLNHVDKSIDSTWVINETYQGTIENQDDGLPKVYTHAEYVDLPTLYNNLDIDLLDDIDLFNIDSYVHVLGGITFTSSTIDFNVNAPYGVWNNALRLENTNSELSRGNWYKVSYTISNYIDGSLWIGLTSNQEKEAEMINPGSVPVASGNTVYFGEKRKSNGTFIEYIKADKTDLLSDKSMLSIYVENNEDNSSFAKLSLSNVTLEKVTAPSLALADSGRLKLVDNITSQEIKPKGFITMNPNAPIAEQYTRVLLTPEGAATDLNSNSILNENPEDIPPSRPIQVVYTPTIQDLEVDKNIFGEKGSYIESLHYDDILNSDEADEIGVGPLKGTSNTNLGASLFTPGSPVIPLLKADYFNIVLETTFSTKDLIKSNFPYNEDKIITGLFGKVNTDGSGDEVNPYGIWLSAYSFNNNDNIIKFRLRYSYDYETGNSGNWTSKLDGYSTTSTPDIELDGDKEYNVKLILRWVDPVNNDGPGAYPNSYKIEGIEENVEAYVVVNHGEEDEKFNWIGTVGNTTGGQIAWYFTDGGNNTTIQPLSELWNGNYPRLNHNNLKFPGYLGDSSVSIIPNENSNPKNWNDSVWNSASIIWDYKVGVRSNNYSQLVTGIDPGFFSGAQINDPVSAPPHLEKIIYSDLILSSVTPSYGLEPGILSFTNGALIKNNLNYPGSDLEPLYSIDLKYYTYVNDMSSPLNGAYKLYTDNLSAGGEGINIKQDQVEIVSILDLIEKTESIKDIPSEYMGIVEELSNDLDFKWDKFVWDRYRWIDGESRKTGIPTYYDATTNRGGYCRKNSDLSAAPEFITELECHYAVGYSWVHTTNEAFTSGTLSNSLKHIESPVIETDNIVLQAGNIFYKDNKYFVYPEVPQSEPIMDSHIPGGQALSATPKATGPLSARFPGTELFIMDQLTQSNSFSGGCVDAGDYGYTSYGILQGTNNDISSSLQSQAMPNGDFQFNTLGPELFTSLQNNSSNPFDNFTNNGGGDYTIENTNSGWGGAEQPDVDLFTPVMGKTYRVTLQYKLLSGAEDLDIFLGSEGAATSFIKTGTDTSFKLQEDPSQAALGNFTSIAISMSVFKTSGNMRLSFQANDVGQWQIKNISVREVFSEIIPSQDNSELGTGTTTQLTWTVGESGVNSDGAVHLTNLGVSNSHVGFSKQFSSLETDQFYKLSYSVFENTLGTNFELTGLKFVNSFISDLANRDFSATPDWKFAGYNTATLNQLSTSGPGWFHDQSAGKLAFQPVENIIQSSGLDLTDNAVWSEHDQSGSSTTTIVDADEFYTTGTGGICLGALTGLNSCDDSYLKPGKYLLKMTGTHPDYNGGTGSFNLESYNGTDTYYTGATANDGDAFDITVDIDTSHGGLKISTSGHVGAAGAAMKITTLSIEPKEFTAYLAEAHTVAFEAGKEYSLRFDLSGSGITNAAIRVEDNTGVEFIKYNSYTIGEASHIRFVAPSAADGLQFIVTSMDSVHEVSGLTLPSGYGWTLNIDDIDISEVLPLRELSGVVGTHEVYFKWHDMSDEGAHYDDHIYIRNIPQTSTDLKLDKFKLEKMVGWAASFPTNTALADYPILTRVLLDGTEPGLDGSTGYVLKVENAAFPAGAVLTNLSIVDNKVYRIKARVWTDAQIRISGSNSFENSPNIATQSTGWQILEAYWYAAETATDAALYISNISNNNTYYIDYLNIRQASPPEALVDHTEVYTSQDICEERGRCVFNDGGATDVIIHGLTTQQCTDLGVDIGHTVSFVGYTFVDPSVYEDVLEGLHIKEQYDAYNKKPALLRQISKLNNFDTYTGRDDGVLEIARNYTEEYDGSIDWKKHYFYIANNDVVSNNIDLPTIHTDSSLTNEFDLRYSLSDNLELDTGLLINERVDANGMLMVVGNTTPVPTTLNISTNKPKLTDDDQEVVLSVELLDEEGAGISEYTVSVVLWHSIGVAETEVPLASLITDITGKAKAILDISMYNGSIDITVAVKTLDDSELILTESINLTRIN